MCEDHSVTSWGVNKAFAPVNKISVPLFCTWYLVQEVDANTNRKLHLFTTSAEYHYHDPHQKVDPAALVAAHTVLYK